jgi:hypothetical protein
MNLDNLSFWVSPLSHELFVGIQKNSVASTKREITGLMINGIVEFMRVRGLPYVEVTQDGKRYRLSIQEAA